MLLLLFLVPCALALPAEVPVGPAEGGNLTHPLGNDSHIPEHLNEGPKRKEECREDSECQPYSYCHYSYWIGESCLTNLKQPDLKTPVKNCSGTDKSGKVIPLHKICRDAEVAAENVEPLYTTSRCYPQLGYTCARSYFMPCTPNYKEDDGSVIAGQEESCPDNFKCTEHSYGSEEKKTDVKLCIPNEPKERFPEKCQKQL